MAQHYHQGMNHHYPQPYQEGSGNKDLMLTRNMGMGVATPILTKVALETIVQSLPGGHLDLRSHPYQEGIGLTTPSLPGGNGNKDPIITRRHDARKAWELRHSFLHLYL